MKKIPAACVEKDNRTLLDEDADLFEGFKIGQESFKKIQTHTRLLHDLVPTLSETDCVLVVMHINYLMSLGESQDFISEEVREIARGFLSERKMISQLIREGEKTKPSVERKSQCKECGARFRETVKQMFSLATKN